MVHSGRYADGRIENIAFDIGSHLDELLLRIKPDHPVFDVPRFDPPSERHILHVATTIHDIGGHTRLIRNWISNDPGSRHSLLLINQGDVQLPKLVVDAVHASQGVCIVLPSTAPRIVKAKWLREISQSCVDFVVLHHDPFDSVPIVAFATEECCPVAVMNHADHVFWLGSSVADLVICIRGFALRISNARRYAKDTALLPVPLSAPVLASTRFKARDRLRIQEDEVVLLSIGAEYKYQPTKTHDFLRTVRRVLDENPNAQLYLIGIENNARIRYLRKNSHKRLHLLGIVENPSDYQLAADLYLEGFPWNSWIALLETSLIGVCPVLMHAPYPQLVMSEDVGLTGLLNNTSNEDEYVQSVNWLVNNEDERVELAKRVRDRVSASHYGEEWLSYLKRVYSSLAEKRHAPAMIPEAPHLQTEDDLNLSNVARAQMVYFMKKVAKLLIFPSKRRKS